MLTHAFELLTSDRGDPPDAVGIFGADASLAGTLRVDGAVALFAFLLPALGAGTCAYLARGTLPLAALLVGAAAGTAAAPELLSSAPLGWLTGVDERDLGSSGLVPTGAVLAALGIVACATELAGKARRAGVAVGAISVVGAVALPVSRVPVLDPWQRFPVKPIAVFETAAGQFIVEPGGGDVLRAMLDQRPLSPRIEELRADAERIAAAVRGVPGPAPKSVLLVGVLTPDRAMVLEELGVERVDRTAHFAGALEPLEALLFQGLERPTGDVLSANEAIDRARRSDYGVVIVLAPGTRGSLGAVHDDGLAGAPTALWLDGRRPVAHLDWTDRVLLASSGIESFSLALTAGLDAAIEYESAPAAPAPRIWSWLRVRPDERPRVAWRDAAERIAAAPVAGDFERGLARHAAVQRISSPFETRAQRVELDDEALASWRDHAVASEELSPFEVGVVEGLTRTIEGKREVPLAYEFVEPILDARPGWVALARTLAWADGEELDFDGAARRLEPYWRSEPLDARTARAYARALVEAGRPREAVDALRPISEARPEDRSLRTQLAEALVVADDPEGRRIAAELLREDPTNALLFDLARGTRGLDTLRSGATTPDDR
ncbi:MAG: tetratricopeptide repeat protein [Planctomycetota bacterium]